MARKWDGVEMRATGAFATAPRRFYDGTDGRQLVDCPDCGEKADALFGDHGGSCIGTNRVALPHSALGLVHAFALEHERFSANDLRPVFEQHGVGPSRRGPAFTTAIQKNWIERDGDVSSTDRKTKRHRVQTYSSLIHPERRKRDAARAVRSDN